MLKLRKVELVGFKSFCEKTQITFSGAGLTCIIGPNGCGKSNIVDAISWVLGEQSHKSLRAVRMSDCIFNGTAKRPPMGLSEVTLTLIDPEVAEAAEFVLGGDAAVDPPAGPVAVPDSAYGGSAEGASADEAQDIVLAEQEGVSEADASTQTEPAASLAELEDTKPKFLKKKRGADKPAMQLKPGEVVVGRRLYRSGESEYLINGRVARLRDIQDLFMGIGLGPDSYAIIEQGRIGQILSSKPTDRRAIIEEAAGITKFKTKKRLSEAKLESSKVNLSRINDIYVEVEKQLASLKRQASKARRYAEIREQMRGLLRQVLASKAKEFDLEAERVAGLLAEVAQRESEQMQSVSQMENEQERLGARTYELEGELRQHHNVLGQTALELDRSENRILFNGQRADELKGRREQLDVEIEQASAQAAQVESRVAVHGESVAALQEDVARLESILATLASASAEISGEHQSTEERIASLRRSAADLGDELTRLHGDQAQAEQALAHHLEDVSKREKQEQQLLEESLYHRERSQAADLHYRSVTEQSRTLGEAVKTLQSRVAGLRAEKQEIAARAESARDALAGGRARRASVEQILNDRSYTADAVQKLFASSNQAGDGSEGFRAVGVLADYAEVEQQYESAIEQFLCDELEYVVVETFDVARAGIALLRDEVGGRATFFIDSLRKLNVQPHEPVVPYEIERETVSRLDRLVQFRDPLGPAAKQFLPRLQSAFLVEAAEVAEGLARENPAYCFVTADGTTYQGRVVSGGRPSDAGPLGMKRELRTLDAEVLQLGKAFSETQAAQQRVEEELRVCEQAFDQTAARHVESEKSVIAATLQRDQAVGEMVRLGMELKSCQTELARLRTEAATAQRSAETAQHRRGEVSNTRAAAEQEIVQAMEQQSALRQNAQAKQEDLAARRAEMAAMAERLASAEAHAARMARELQELVARRAALVAQQASLGQEQEQLLAQNDEHKRQVESLKIEKHRLEARGGEMEQEFDSTRVRSTHVEDALRLARQRLGDLREERSKHEIERARNDSEREHLRQSCVEQLNAQPEDLIVEYPTLLSGEELRAADSQYHEMNSRIESMGPINMMALEEFNECEQRFGFLDRERQDLLQSITDTQQAITELDEVCRQKFEDAFVIINGNFATAFHTLFGGGTGEMRLSEPDSSGEPGIDVAAQPPGKRLQNVLLLSGGEKAMTALALLIAIFKYQPSPFCILDEVDAPLDEANVGRFTKLVSEMSAGTQFIVVTHNRRTMEMASTLYGVTMQEQGVSKLVSVRWDDAVAAQAATNAA